MDVPRRGLRFSLLAALVVLAAAPHGADARRYLSYAPHHDVPGAIPHGNTPAPAAAVDAGPGPLKIPNAALEPAKWSDLDGWGGDDHASAFATFAASCRPIVRSSAVRAEPSRVRSARTRVAHPAPAGD